MALDNSGHCDIFSLQLFTMDNEISSIDLPVYIRIRDKTVLYESHPTVFFKNIIIFFLIVSPPSPSTEPCSTDHTKITMEDNLEFNEDHHTAKSLSSKIRFHYLIANSSSFFQLEEECLNLRFHDFQRRSVIKPAELQNQLEKPPMNKNTGNENGIVGSMFGLAIGDALGAHVEFRPHDYLLQNPVTDFEAGGTWGLAKGQVQSHASSSSSSRKNLNYFSLQMIHRWHCVSPTH